MNKQDYLKFHEDFLREMLAVCHQKNSDYTGNSLDPFANFGVVDTIGIATTTQGFLVRMMDKIMRVKALTVDERTQQVKNESIRDTLMDLANYSVLLAGYIESTRDMPEPCKHEQDVLGYNIDEKTGQMEPVFRLDTKGRSEK